MATFLIWCRQLPSCTSIREQSILARAVNTRWNARLTLADRLAGIEIDHIAFQEPCDDPEANTAFLERSLQEARFVRTSPPRVAA